MTHAVVDQLEPVQVEEQHRESLAIAMARTIDRRRQAVQQVRPVRQAGQTVMRGLIGEPLLGTHAFANLRHQLRVGFGQFMGACIDAAFELYVRQAKMFLGALLGQSIADVVGNKIEQALVMRTEADIG